MRYIVHSYAKQICLIIKILLLIFHIQPKKKLQRFNSLQQQYKILSTKHDDLEQQCTEAKKSMATENDELKRKLDHVKAQLDKTLTSRDNDVAMWKV